MLFCADGNSNRVKAGSQAQSADWVIVVAVIIGEVLPKRMVKLPLSRYICARGNHNSLCGHDKRGAQRRPVVFESKSQRGSKCGRHMYVHIDKFTAKKTRMRVTIILFLIGKETGKIGGWAKSQRHKECLCFSLVRPDQSRETLKSPSSTERTRRRWTLGAKEHGPSFVSFPAMPVFNFPGY